MPSASLKFKSPFELLYQKQLDLAQLNAYGCLCFITTSTVGCDKFMSRAHPCVLIGYPIRRKAFKVLNLTAKAIHIARDIKFFENIFPLHAISNTMSQNPHSFLPTNSSDTLIAPSPSSIFVPIDIVSYSQTQPPNISRRTYSYKHV